MVKKFAIIKIIIIFVLILNAFGYVKNTSKSSLKADKIRIDKKIYKIIPGSIIQRPLDIIDVYNGDILDIDVKINIKINQVKHLGIYIGKGRVIHFNGESLETKAKAKIVYSKLKDFAKSNKKNNTIFKIEIKKKPKNKRHSTAIIKEAISIYKKNRHPKYNLVFANCESFAKHCYEKKYYNGKKYVKESYGKTQVDTVEGFIVDTVDMVNKDAGKYTKDIFNILDLYEENRDKEWAKNKKKKD